jgi:hypothetical protein
VRQQKPIIHIAFTAANREGQLFSFRHWLKEHDIKTLNVAGNRESKAPGLQTFTRDFLLEVFSNGG